MCGLLSFGDRYVIRNLVAVRGSLHIMLRITEVQRFLGLPSWVLDWCAEQDETILGRDRVWLMLYRYTMQVLESQA